MNWILTGVLSLLTYSVIRKKKLFLPTASGAFIMAAGILFNVYEKQKSLVSVEIGVVISLLAALLIGFSMSFLQEAFKGIVYRRHFTEPISSFATGTWVAAYSIVIITIASWFPTFRLLAIFFYVIDVVLWFGFIALVVRNFVLLLQNINKRRKVNGVIFLSCVATQSVALATATLFGKNLPSLVLLISIGGFFYILCFGFMIYRLFKFNWGNIAEEWANTNCIVHGALSITGLAGIMTSTLSIGEIGLLWLITSVLFTLVEGIELVRMYQRVRRFGWSKGLFVYNSTQWARNFTFGMFMAFTLNLPWRQCDFCGHALSMLWRDVWVFTGIPFLLMLFFLEMALFIKQIFFEKDSVAFTEQSMQLKSAAKKLNL